MNPLSKTHETPQKHTQHTPLLTKFSYVALILLVLWAWWMYLHTKNKQDPNSPLEVSKRIGRHDFQSLNHDHNIPQSYILENEVFDLQNIIYETSMFRNLAILNHTNIQLPNNRDVTSSTAKMMFEPSYWRGFKVNLPIVQAFMKKNKIQSSQDIINFVSSLKDKYKPGALGKPPALTIYLIDSKQTHIWDCDDLAYLSFCMAYVLHESSNLNEEWGLFLLKIHTSYHDTKSNQIQEVSIGHAAIVIWDWDSKKVFDPLIYTINGDENPSVLPYREWHQRISWVIKDEDRKVERTYTQEWILYLSDIK